MSFITNSSRIRTGPRWCPAIAFAVIIFTFSSMPANEIRQTYHKVDTLAQPTAASPASPIPFTISGMLRRVPLFSNIDLLKIGHAIGYFFLGLTVLYGLGSRGWRWSPMDAAGICCLYAISDELHQLFVPGRSSSPGDVVIDTLAALCGAGVLFFRKRANM